MLLCIVLRSFEVYLFTLSLGLFAYLTKIDALSFIIAVCVRVFPTASDFAIEIVLAPLSPICTTFIPFPKVRAFRFQEATVFKNFVLSIEDEETLRFFLLEDFFA